MLLTDLLRPLGIDLPAEMDTTIAGLASDSRHVEKGFLFAALPGAKHDGAAFIQAALAQGAAAILCTSSSSIDVNIPLLETANPRLMLARMAASFYAPQPKNVVAITGTNGKTSTAHFAMQLWQGAGIKSATMGTVGLFGSGLSEPGTLTTPDPIELHRTLARLKGLGIEHVALEASSHGLDQFRLDGLQLKAAGFTYLGRDHLDYHGAPENYFAAKASLFSRLLPVGGTAVLNADVPEFAALHDIATQRQQPVLRYGVHGHELKLLQATPLPTGLALDLDVLGKRHSLSLPLTGAFQAPNVLCALGLVLGSGLPVDNALNALSHLHNVAGRMERVATTPQGAAIYVDYAHTADALETVLKALRPHTTGRLIVVFGCGGNRDKGKRPLMGAVAQKYADIAYITDDNPRLEDAAAIRADVLAGAPNGIEVNDRAKAIQQAIETLQANDVLLLAGKGHEQGQIVGHATLPFDDAEIARQVVGNLG